MKIRLISAILITAISLSACGKSTGDALEDIIVSTEEVLASPALLPSEMNSSNASESGDIPAEEVSDEESPDKTNVAVKFVFNPHVFSERDTIRWGEDTRETFFNFVDALRNGDETFECASEKAFYNATGGRLINYYFPVASVFFYQDYDIVFTYDEGIGRIDYNGDKERFLETEKEFERVVTDILNENVKPSYSDFEKAMALYLYMSTAYTYDFDMYEIMYTRYCEEITTYRAMVEKMGICQELSGIYNYLLLQCGVESDVIGGSDHQWNFVNINGKDYHIDPTWGLSNPYIEDGKTPLEYFLMTDEDREANSGYLINTFGICGLDGTESREMFDFAATDESFKPFRLSYFIDMDTDKNIVTYYDFIRDETQTFQYVD
ncbi:MAG: hypothetical protein J6I66_10125 [Lachnospiraceae bacterium]|nr:hypothetical protein [Clostridiales bacterium]MBP3755202.1 hypothetical protein [Lachnospiraceae bacterium]